MIDLHMHTTASDGMLSQKALVDLACKAGLNAIAITDHDTTKGIRPALEYAKEKGLEVVPGIEIECSADEIGFEALEIVGLFVSPENSKLADFVESTALKRISQKKEILQRLKQQGFAIDFEELKASAEGSLGRPHIARLLVEKHPKEFPTVRNAFEKQLAAGKPSYVRRESRPSLEKGINLVKEAGGLSFLAHPGIFHHKGVLKAIDFFKSKGGQGIETYYPYHVAMPKLGLDSEKNQEMVEFYQKIAKERNLLESGGSDFHGGDRQTLNAVKVPDRVLEKIKETLKKGLWFYNG